MAARAPALAPTLKQEALRQPGPDPRSPLLPCSASGAHGSVAQRADAAREALKLRDSSDRRRMREMRKAQRVEKRASRVADGGRGRGAGRLAAPLLQD